jgi:hypothetical protein
MRITPWFRALVIGLTASCCSADIIPAAPGAGTISAACAKAKEGDTIKLAEGEYADTAQVPAGVTVEGAGASKTIVNANGYAAINCAGARVVVRALTIKGGTSSTRGINTSQSLRVERCRFDHVKEAVAMMSAPLSDVVACEFVDCSIGVRAIGGACPTVYGCLFSGGDMGVFAMDGMPYVRNCIFSGSKVGIRILPGDETAIVRNCLFVSCKDSAIDLLSKDSALFGPSIRNCIFEGCGAAMIASTALASRTSHCVVHAVPQPAFHDKGGAEVFKVAERSISEGDCGAAVGPGGAVTFAHPELLDGKGVHAGGDAADVPARIGIEGAIRVVGCGMNGDLPPVRFTPPNMIANAVAEEYQYMKMSGLSSSNQGVGEEAGRRFDELTCDRQGSPVKLRFDITRFWDEMSIRP